MKTNHTFYQSHLLFVENVPFLARRDSDLYNKWEIKENIRVRVAALKGDTQQLVSVTIVAMVSTIALLACLLTIGDNIIKLLNGNNLLARLGLIAVVGFVAVYCFRISLPSLFTLVLQVWLRFDKYGSERIYNNLVRRGKLSVGRVLNVIEGYDSSSIYFSCNGNNAIRYFSIRKPLIGSEIIVLYNKIIYVII